MGMKQRSWYSDLFGLMIWWPGWWPAAGWWPYSGRPPLPGLSVQHEAAQHAPGGGLHLARHSSLHGGLPRVYRAALDLAPGPGAWQPPPHPPAGPGAAARGRGWRGHRAAGEEEEAPDPGGEAAAEGAEAAAAAAGPGRVPAVAAGGARRRGRAARPCGGGRGGALARALRRVSGLCGHYWRGGSGTIADCLNKISRCCLN